MENKSYSKWMLFATLFFCLFQFTTSAYSLIINGTFERISTKDGLSQSTVNSIIQDKNGFMWFATYDGINKYDGYHFKTYKHIQNDSTSLSHNTCITLFEDNDGYIWIVNSGNTGLDKFDPKTEKFTRYIHNPEDSSSISSNVILNVYQDKTGNIWVCTANAVNLVVNKKSDDKIVTSFKHFYNTSNTIPFSMVYEDRNGKLLIFADYLFWLDRKNYKIHKTNTPLFESTLTSLCEDNAGYLWLASSLNGIIKLSYDKRTDQYKRIDPGKVNITPNNRNYILFDNKDRIWIGTESKGLFQYIPNEDRLINFVNHENDSKSISDNTIYSLFIDRSGILWIGTFSQGLCKYDFYKKQFEHIKSIPGIDPTLSGSVISSIHSTKPGELWIGVDLEGGINRFIFQDDKDPKVMYYKNNPYKSNTIGGNSIICLIQRINGEVWAGSANGSVSKIIPEKYGSNKQPIIDSYKFSRWTFSIFEDRQETVWGGTWDAGLWRYNEDVDSFTFFMNDPNNPLSICDNIIWAINEDNNGNIWIGGHGKGLSILPSKDKYKSDPEFINYKFEQEKKTSLSDNTIHAFCMDKRGAMWIGTANGLNKVLRKNNDFSNIDADHELGFESYHISDGLPSEAIVGIVEDDNGNLWLSTSNGVSKFNVLDSLFTNYYEDDGLQSNEFWHNAYFKDQNGKIYFGGNNGLNAFYPDSIKSNPFPPQIVFTDFKLFYKSIHVGEKINNDIIISKTIDETSEIILSHKNNIFSIEFAALHYTNPKKNRYAYMLEGFDKEWVQTSAEYRFASYTSLPSGNYKFKVKASNNDGLWNKKEKSLRIIILPPFWQTWWFISLIILFIGFLVYVYLHYRTKSITEQNILLEKAVKKKTFEMENLMEKMVRQERLATIGQVAGSIAHELRNPLGSVRQAIFYLKHKLNNLPEKLITHFDLVDSELDIANKVIDDLMEITRVRRINKEYFKLEELLNDSIKRVGLDGKIKIDIDIDKKATHIYADYNQLRQVFINLITNAVHALKNSGTISVSSYLADSKDYIQIMIKDNGSGIKKENVGKIFEPLFTTKAKGTGLGLSICKQIIEKHRGQIKVISKENESTTILIWLPVDKEIPGDNKNTSTSKE